MKVEKLLQSRVFPPKLIEDRDLLLNVARRIPIPHLVLVFLGMKVFLAPRNGGVLAQLEPVVDAVDWRQRRRQHQPDAERRPAALLQKDRTAIGGLGEQRWPE